MITYPRHAERIATGVVVEPGMAVMSGRRQVARLVAVTRSAIPGKSGKVTVCEHPITECTGVGAIGHREYYDRVWGLKVVTLLPCGHRLTESYECSCDLSTLTGPRVFVTMLAIKAANQAAGQHWFSRDTMRFFSSRLSETVYPVRTIGGALFVTSEQYSDEHGRRYSVRYARPDGHIDTVITVGRDGAMSFGSRGFQQYTSRGGAHYAAKTWAARITTITEEA